MLYLCTYYTYMAILSRYDNNIFFLYYNSTNKTSSASCIKCDEPTTNLRTNKTLTFDMLVGTIM